MIQLEKKKEQKDFFTQSQVFSKLDIDGRMADRNEAAPVSAPLPRPWIPRGLHQHILKGGNIILSRKNIFSGANGPWRRCDLDEMREMEQRKTIFKPFSPLKNREILDDKFLDGIFEFSNGVEVFFFSRNRITELKETLDRNI